MNKTVDVKLTEKEEKAIATVVAFFQGLKDCKKEDEEKYLIENAFASRMILSFGKAEPKNAHTILSSALINKIQKLYKIIQTCIVLYIFYILS